MDAFIGEIVDLQEDGTALIRANLPVNKAIYQSWDKCELRFSDARTISPEQRKKAYALLAEITEWQCGDRNEIEFTKSQLKVDFLVNRAKSTGAKMFSLSNCSVELASHFISYLVEFCMEWDVPTKQPLGDYADDLRRYTYAAIIHKRCVICGKPSDLHHCEGGRIGLGGNRDKVSHIGRPALPLCRVHHNECHATGETTFLEKYHIQPVTIDERIAKLYRLKA